ncbi:arylsulfatase D isoform X1 [Callorhinchus milii]|uniref:arylsulfatase D isoform X1 n=1 Tax=Callorhinchus milii TaxID=7868 RepID=UPI001C3FAC97|nr:arylsulfatase D isoform X1 [Callorhinchus milii]XP_042190630.1 arylsulfatase D isoform X1 [Callorhinchus milii]XP_042190631.1 arylsulfatase D isoform X1 [Callorhinchus milii]XP_042190632.1 arylsulfatase D isoform X1 [Callorhinchus milii]XP_042190633.1 arylsulfatase D isoform X1 [Callorhinchus milii]XP_042190634.1 arylsulfatase D isoform X1 [Callorhinchus milii]
MDVTNRLYRMLVLHALGLSSVLVTRVMSTDSKSQPNFVVIMADDLGIGDVGCYGNDILRTPNIDRLAQEGVRLTHHIAAAPLCTPSRAAFMTGRYPVRSGMDNSHRVRVILFNAGTGGLPPNETTFAKLLQQEGYSTGIVGKWHLGVNCESREDWCHHPLSHGFGYFYGTPFTNFLDCKPGAGSNLLVDVAAVLSRINQALALGLLSLVALKLFGLASLGWRPIGCLTILCLLFFISWFSVFGYIRLWNCIAMRDFKVVQQPIQLESFPTRLTHEALAFIKRNQKKPFLLFVSLLHVHTPLFMTKGFVGNSKNGLYGDNVEEMDWHVGQIVNTIDELGLANRTLIHFTSDHGGSIEEIRERLGDCNGIYKGGKGMAGWEGGIRVPGLFRWPGVLTAGRTIDEPTSLMDIYPTLANLAGAHLPQDRVIDGRDLMPLLEAKVRRSEHEFLFHYCGNELHAVRWHPRARPLGGVPLVVRVGARFPGNPGGDRSSRGAAPQDPELGATTTVLEEHPVEALAAALLWDLPILWMPRGVWIRRLTTRKLHCCSGLHHLVQLAARGPHPAHEPLPTSLSTEQYRRHTTPPPNPPPA